MSSVIIMCLGILVGHYFFARRYQSSDKGKKVNEIFQVTCTILLIFSMGVLLGSDKDLMSKISTMGIESFLLFLIPGFLSVLLVHFLSERFLKKKK